MQARVCFSQMGTLDMGQWVVICHLTAAGVVLTIDWSSEWPNGL